MFPLDYIPYFDCILLASQLQLSVKILNDLVSLTLSLVVLGHVVNIVAMKIFVLIS